MAYPVNVMFAMAAPGALQPAMSSLLPEWLDPQVFLADPAFGPWVVLLVCGIVFVETGLLVGFFLPGDSLLFTAGLLVATGAIQVNIWVLILLVALCAFAGDQLGYFIGRKAGPVVFNRPDSRLFRQENVTRAEVFFARHGGKAVVLARFVPVVRTFTPVVAGVGRMHYATFIAYNAIGAAVWAMSVTLLGYLLGDRVPFVRDNLDLIFLGVIGLTLVFVVAGLIRPGRRTGRAGRPGSSASPGSSGGGSSGSSGAGAGGGGTAAGAPGNDTPGENAPGSTRPAGNAPGTNPGSTSPGSGAPRLPKPQPPAPEPGPAD